MTTATPGQAERDYAEFTRWWEAKGYHDGQQVDFSDARDAFASGMRAARIAAQEPHSAPLWPDGAPVRDADGDDEPKAAPGLVAAHDAKVNYDALVTIGIVLKHAKDDAEAVRVTAAIIADALQGKGPEPQPAPELAKAETEQLP